METRPRLRKEPQVAGRRTLYCGDSIAEGDNRCQGRNLDPYIDHQDAYKSLAEALKHGGIRQRTRVKLKWLESGDIERDGTSLLAGVDGILVPGGFGDRGFEGKVLTAQYARETGIPYFGICYGMQAAVVDYARHMLGMADANSTENDRQSTHPVIGLITEWRTASGDVERRSEESDLGSTMRRGLQEQRVKPRTLAHRMYGKDVVGERHRHRYEFNNRYRTQLGGRRRSRL